LPTGKRRFAPPALAFSALFGLLATLAWPALLHHVRALGGDLAIVAIETDRPLTEAGLQRALTSRREALTALEHNRTRRELGQAYVRRVREPEVRFNERSDDLEAATQAIRKALARAPADHFAWYHLAMAEALADRQDDAARALATAYTFGPYHPPIREARIRLGMALWPVLEPSSRSLVLAELAEVRADERR
jgi:tetratricopeptide (TPR) repeat protein